MHRAGHIAITKLKRMMTWDHDQDRMVWHRVSAAAQTLFLQRIMRLGGSCHQQPQLRAAVQQCGLL
jgi:hypothetical protein